MGIVVVVRTLNEAHRIGQFCAAYTDADKILVADGGSEDNTIEIAKSFPNVEVRNFTERVQLANGYWRNNDSSHANFLYEWAYTLNPDWVLYDDCDCTPNYLLKQDYRKILAETDKDIVMAVRIYYWGLDQHFPRMAQPGAEGRWEASLWGWRGNQDLWTIDIPPAYNFRVGKKVIADFRKDCKTLELFPPYALLHKSWDNEERVEKKTKYYIESGFIPGFVNPKIFGGPLEPLPEWARD